MTGILIINLMIYLKISINVMIIKASKNKWKSFKKTIRRMEKGISVEHQNPYLWVVAKRRHKVERKFWKENLSLNSCTTYIGYHFKYVSILFHLYA
jgi:hypothetical protein